MWITYEQINVISGLATAIGVLLVVWQIRLAKQIEMTHFEDDLTNQYRETIKDIPIQALLKEDLNDEDFEKAFSVFYRYIDLTNEQVFLRSTGRISQKTWCLWRDGIRTQLNRKAFARAWQKIKEAVPEEFKELQRLEKNFEKDPFYWSSSL